MDGSIQDIDAQRARWVRHRQPQKLTSEAGDDFACGGLARYADELEMRLVCLPSDPVADVVPLDGQTLEWLKRPREAPYGGHSPPWWTHRERTTSSALVRYEQPREGDVGWRRYLALHRHGGIEVGSSRLTYETSGKRVFRLRLIVAMAWTAAALQTEAIERWQLQAPFELTIGLRKTRGAALGHLAEGWQSPGQGFGDEFPTCLEDHVLLRREVDGMIDPQGYAMNLGDRLEQAFGSTMHRHVARIGEYVGRFDPRF
jgi:hypothetical protein